MHPLRSVLCATDIADAASEEIAQAASLAAGDRARLTILHVVAPPTAYATTGVEVAPPVIDESALLQEARTTLDRRLATLGEIAPAAREVVRAAGSVASEILRRAESLP